MALSLFHLHGDLKDLRFPRLLAALREDAFTGVFQATTRGSDEPPGPDVDAASQAAETTREVHFSGGHIAWAISTEREESLKAYLIRNGALTAAQWSQAEERARDVTLRQALIDLGLVAARELTQIERGRAEEIVLTLFTARNGEYRVRERQLAPGTPDLKIDPRPLILKGVVEAGDRALILDEIGSLDSVYVVKRSPQEDAAFTLPGEFQSILRHIDGKRSIAQICALTSLPDYFACALFAALSMAGAVKRSYTKGQPRGRAEIVRGADVADSAVRARPPLPASEPPQTPLVLEAAPELEPEPAPEPEPPVEPAETVKAQPTARPPIITTARPAPPKPAPASERPSFYSETAEDASRPWFLLGGAAAVGFAALVLILMSQNSGDAVETPSRYSDVPAGAPERAPTTVEPETEEPESAESPSTAGLQVAPPAPGPVASPRESSMLPGDPGVRMEQGNPGDGHRMLLAGDYLAAARDFGRRVAAQPGRFTIQILTACQDDTVRRAVESAAGSPDVFILSTMVDGRSCYRVYWGSYASRKNAEEALRHDIPAVFRNPKSPPRVTRLAGS